MYELVLRNEYEKYEIDVEHMSLFDDPISINDTISTSMLYGDEHKGITVFDIDFSNKVKQADKQDYIFAIFSGSITAAIDQFIIGKTDLSKLEDLDKKRLFDLAKNVLYFCNYSEKKIDDLESRYSKYLDNAKETIRNASKYKDLAIDFRKSLSVKSLFFTIFAVLTGIVIGEDEKCNLSIALDENEYLYTNSNFYQKIEFGFISWLIEQADEYNSTGKFKEEINDLVKGKNGINRLKELIKPLANSRIFKDKSIDKTEIYKILLDKVSEDTSDVSLEAKSIPFKEIVSKQMIPVLINKCLVRTYLFIKILIHDLNEKRVKSLEGLRLLDISVNSQSNKRIIARMDTVSTGVFSAMDGVEALVYASKEAAIAAENAERAFEGDDNMKAAAMAAAGLRAGVFAYASSINIVNAFELVAVVKTDSKYLIEDAKRFLDKEIVAKKTAQMLAREKEREILREFRELKNTEKKILYSLMLDLIEYDIRNTKDSETQVKKDHWKLEWMELSEKTIGVNKLFYKDQDKIYAQINTKAGNHDDKIWLYRIALDLIAFEPYGSLNQEKKERTKLKLVNKSYIDNVFCQKQNIVTEDDIKKMKKAYIKHFNYIGGSTENVAKGAAGAVLAAGAASAAAFAFAPAIAVALVGNAFAGIYGAALTSASLAMLGGGAVAIGGLGMAGGTMVIAGGGALLGLGASGLTLTTLILMSSPATVQMDYAKLLTDCEYILIGKYSKTSDVTKIRDQVIDEIKQYNIQLELIKNAESFKDKKIQKELAKELEKSLGIVTRAEKVLDKLVKSSVVERTKK